MNICAFSVVFWDNQQQANELRNHLDDWNTRIDSHAGISKTNVFLSTGNYSNPNFNPCGNKLIQLGIERQIDQQHRVNYFRCGFMAAMYYFLLNKESIKWDVISYIHYSVLLGIDIKDHIEQFAQRPESLMAPQLVSPDGVMIENALMFMKESAVKRWVLNSSIKDPLCGNEYIITEEETTILFQDDWFNPFESITSIRPKTIPSEHVPASFSRSFDLDHDTIMRTPIIFGLPKHCDKHTLQQWKLKYP